MGRALSSAGGIASGTVIYSANGFPLIGGMLPLFGTGRFRIFYPGNGVVNYVPTVGPHRIRVLGGGGSSLLDGQTSSFGALISATGGSKPNLTVGGAGGIGVGGSFQATGGAGGAGLNTGGVGRAGGGGGAAGSQLGNGGAGGAGAATAGSGWGYSGGGGGGVAGNAGGSAANVSPYNGAGGSAYGPGATGVGGVNLAGIYGPTDVANAVVALPYFGFTGGGSAYNSQSGGSGGGGAGSVTSSYDAGQAGAGGGGGGAATNAGFGMGGKSPFGGGQGGTVDTGSGLTGLTSGGAGGGGFAMGTFDLTIGATYAVTVAQPVMTTEARVVTSPGIVIIEF